MTVIHEITVPKDDSDEEVLIVDIFFQTKDQIDKDSNILDIETSKTVIQLDTPIEGYVEYLVETGESAAVGQVIARIHDSPSSIDEIQEEEISSLEDSTDNKGREVVKKRITKDAQDLIDKNSIDVSLIDSPLIRKKDVEDFLSKKQDSESNDFEDPTIISRPINQSKKIEIKALSSVQTLGLVCTIFVNVKAIKIEQSNNLFANTEESYLPIITNEVSKLLKEFPTFNAYFFNDEIREYKEVNVGIALDIDDGLKVLTLPNTDTLNLSEITNLISEGIYKYLRKNLTPKDLTGSTFTITDLSKYGVDRFVPLINKRQSAILGISSVDEALDRFNLSLSFDHRVTEGRKASEFLNRLKERIENFDL